MRRTTTTIIALAGLLLAGTASAAETPKDKGSSTGPGSTASTQDEGGGKTDNPLDSRDKVVDTAPTTKNKIWEVSAGAEYHHLVGSDYYTANAASNNVVAFSAGASISPSPYDKISVRWGFYQSFLVDSGDSSIRSDDIGISYSRRIPLPAQFTLVPSFGLTVPISYGSQLVGMYTSPRLSLSVIKKFGKYVSVDGRAAGSLYLMKYASGGWAYNGAGVAEGTFECSSMIGCNGGGAVPNSRASLSLGINADFAMPFHEALSLSISAFTGYGWYYNVSNGGGCPAGTPSTVCMYGAENGNYTQPDSQRYGYEVSVHYAFPTVAGLKTDAFFAYAPLGDPTIGYKSILNGNGVPNYYGAYFSLNEVYMGINARY